MMLLKGLHLFLSLVGGQAELDRVDSGHSPLGLGPAQRQE